MVSFPSFWQWICVDAKCGSASFGTKDLDVNEQISAEDKRKYQSVIPDIYYLTFYFGRLLNTWRFLQFNDPRLNVF